MIAVTFFAGLVFTLVFVLFRLATLAQQVAEQHATSAPATQDAAADQQAHQAIIAIALFAGLIFALVFVLFRLATLAQQVAEQHATSTPATQHAAADQQAHQAMVAITLFAGLIFTLVFVVFRLPMLAQQVREQHATGTPTAQDAAADQQAHELSFLATVILIEAFLAFMVFVLRLTTLPQQVCEQQVAQSAAA